MLQNDSTQTIDHIQKCFRQKNTETFVWNIFRYDQKFECYRSVTLYVPHPVYVKGCIWIKLHNIATAGEAEEDIVLIYYYSLLSLSTFLAATKSLDEVVVCGFV